jgi:hypothetical protein
VVYVGTDPEREERRQDAYARIGEATAHWPKDYSRPEVYGYAPVLWSMVMRGAGPDMDARWQRLDYRWPEGSELAPADR